MFFSGLLVISLILNLIDGSYAREIVGMLYRIGKQANLVIRKNRKNVNVMVWERIRYLSPVDCLAIIYLSYRFAFQPHSRFSMNALMLIGKTFLVNCLYTL